jgi:hypothetical protein
VPPTPRPAPSGAGPAAPADALYLSRLSACASLYPELQILLSKHTHALPRQDYRRQVIEDNALARRTLAARRKTWKELAPRYGLDAASAVFVAFVEEYHRSASDADRALAAYLLFALRDRLVADLAPTGTADLGTDWLYAVLTKIQWQFYNSPLRAVLMALGLN